MSDDLLTKFMLGETTLEENEWIEKWMKENKANEKRFAHFKLIWETSKRLALVSTVDEQEAWNRFKQIKSQPIRHEAPVKPLYTRLSWLNIAAVFVLVTIGAWASYNFFIKPGNDSIAIIHLQTEKEVRIETLPDGSVITLNKHSKLNYPEIFSGDQREISLQAGEAFFNVTPDKSKPFIVKVNEVTVRVVGTSFNIKSRQDKTEVIVETGRVEVSKQNSMVALAPKEKVLINKNDTDLTKEKNTDRLYNYYRSKEFTPDGTPLWRMVEVLNEAYDVHIIIERENLRNLPLTTTFKNESLDNILDIIGKTFKIEVVKKDNEIILK